MSMQIHKIGAFFPKSLISMVGMGIVIFSMLIAGCKHKDSGDSTVNESTSPEAIAKRIEPVGKVNIIHSSEKISKTAAAPAEEETTQTTAAPEDAKKKAPQTSAPDAKASPQATDTEQTSSMASGKASHEPPASSEQK